VGSVDAQSGKVAAGRANHPRVYALALLSVGAKAASWPLVFEPKRSFVPRPPKLIAPPGVPPIRVLGLSAASIQAPPQAPPPATPPPPAAIGLNVPAPPAIPTFPSATALPIAPPAPLAPPPPPASTNPLPLSLSLNLSGVAVPPTPGVSAQPTPPVNPAPPGGARKEARQKQAATAKSEEGESSGVQERAGVDTAEGPYNPSAFTRRDRIAPAADGFTPLHHRAQPSAWTTGLQWGGGIGLMALALALGFTTVRPTPRRRPGADVTPAPAYVHRRRR
jgi:hypothetical protein